MHAGPTKALDQHPFVARLLQHIDLNADDLKTFEALIVDEVTVSRRRDLIVDGYEYRKLSFIRDGYAVRTSCRATASVRFSTCSCPATSLEYRAASSSAPSIP
jgi:hypothetical protein